MNNIEILKEIKDILYKRFGDIIDKIILFGSRINGISDGYSDYDILIILKTSYDWQKKNEILFSIYDICLVHDILIDAKIISANEMTGIRGKQPYIQSAVKNGVSI